MGYRATHIEIRGLLTLSAESAERLLKHPKLCSVFEDDRSDPDTVTNAFGIIRRRGVSFGVASDKGRTIASLPRGEEGFDRHLVDFLRFTAGNAQVFITWEGGDSLSGLDVSDGVVCEREVVMTLGTMKKRHEPA